MKTPFKRLLCTGLLLQWVGPVLAHEVHGLPGVSHWHVTDTWGFIVTGVALVVAIWLSRSDKP